MPGEPYEVAGMNEEMKREEYPHIDSIEMQAERISRQIQTHAPIQKPSIGRIVIYNHPGSADGKYPAQQSPAIIQHVNDDGTCRLWVFGPKGLHTDDNLKQGDGPCEWNWPARV